MQDDKIKEAFSKVKEDIDNLISEVLEVRKELNELKDSLKTPTHQVYPTNQPTNNSNTPTQTSTDKRHLYALKSPNLIISTGNEGVPTNQPTNQQTNQHPTTSSVKFALNTYNAHQTEEKEDRISRIRRASEILNSLDELKKEIRIKFKKLSNKEMLIFSTIYQLQEQGFVVDYALLSEKLGLSEISIRDYVRKITNKGIPVDKLKEDNKKVILSIPEDLKKIASLNTILQLREL